MLEWSVIGVLACLLSYAGVAGLRRWAERKQVLDIPNERSSHAQPKPRGGGLAIVVVVLLGLTTWQLMRDGLTLAWLTYLIGAALVAGVSWLDDLYSLPMRVRFAAHCVGALLAVWGFGPWHLPGVPLFSDSAFAWWLLPLTFFWIVGLCNVYNFMDGIDGLAGSQALVAGAGWALFGLLAGHATIGTLGLLLAAVSLGFLGHNWSPARIFMGDVGSVFLGYTFAVMSVAASQRDPQLGLIGVILVWPFLFDAAFTLLSRLRRRENVFSAHRSHLYQRLIITGYGHQAVTMLYIGLDITGVILAVAWFTGVVDGVTTAGLLAVLCLALWLFTVSRERNRTASLVPQPRQPSTEVD